MNRQPEIKAILFDLDNTLIDRTVAVSQYFIHLLRPVFPKNSQGRLQNSLKDILQQDDLGYADRNEFCRWVTSQYLHLTHWTVQTLWNDFSKKMPQFILPNLKLQTFLKQLKKQYQLAIITNGSVHNQQKKIQAAQLGTFFDHIFVSEEIGKDKPNPFIFKTALNALSVEPDQALYVGDHPENDIVGASNAGMKTCWVTLDREFPSKLSQPHYQISSIDSLPSLFPCLTPASV